MKTALPLTSFRAYGENKSLYFRVVIWKTLKDFRAANPGNSRALGLCRSFRVMKVQPKGSTKRDRFKPILGEIHLAARFVTVGILSHEACHAMMSWAEEAHCTPLFLVRQIVHRLYRRKILTVKAKVNR